jgi:hypothetical protein
MHGLRSAASSEANAATVYFQRKPRKGGHPVAEIQYTFDTLTDEERAKLDEEDCYA